MAKSLSSQAGKHTYSTTAELIAMFPVQRKTSSNSKCLVHALAVLVILLAIGLVFAIIVVRVRDPKIELRSVRMIHTSYSASPSASLNVTMIARVTLKNPNFGPFDYGNSTVSVLYGVTSLGAGEMGGGKVRARETKEISVLVKLRSNGIHSGTLKIRSYSKLSGTVHLLKIVKKRKNIVMACIVNLNLMSHSLYHFQC